MDWKSIAKQALIAAGVVALYHMGTLDFVPVFKGSKKAG